MDTKTLLIAEIGHNWMPYGFDSITTLIHMVRDAGWDIAKFQAYDTDKIKQPGDTNYQELKDAELSGIELSDVAYTCKQSGVEFMASAFDVERVKLLEDLSVRRHKVASRTIHDQAVIQAMLETGKSVIASLGAWNESWLPTHPFHYLYCKSRRQILQKGFDVEEMKKELNSPSIVGFSDHTIGNHYAIRAMQVGAEVIEKHITFNKNAAGWDQPSSADYNDMLEIAKYRR